jgi:hypothetical protein
MSIEKRIDMVDPNGKPNIVRVELYTALPALNTNGNYIYKIYYDKDPMAMEAPDNYCIEATQYATFRFAKDELEAWASAQKTLDVVYAKLTKDK